MYDLTKEFLSNRQWAYTEDVHETVFFMYFRITGDMGVYDCRIINDVGGKRFIAFCQCGILVPENKIEYISNLLMKINSDMFLGNFIVNLNERTIYYKTSVDYEYFTPTIELVEQLVNTSINMMDTHFLDISKEIIAE